MMPPKPLLRPTDRGLACAVGGLLVDPWQPAPVAVVTHAHADHACRGCGRYYCAAAGAGVLRTRMGADAEIHAIEYGTRFTLADESGEAELSFHPAGHVLGSAQVRIRAMRGAQDDRVWVASGDYATLPNPTCDAFEPVACDVFLTESTFGLPIYRWRPPAEVHARINDWWRENAGAGRTSVVFAYGLGKAQRVLAGLDASIGPIGVHGAVDGLLGDYADAGVALPETVRAVGEHKAALKGRGMIVAPPSTMGTPWLRSLAGGRREGGGMRTAMASGWMAVRGRRRWRSVDAGFVLSDHADWPGLLDAIERTGARSIGVTHGSSEALARYVREVRGLDAFVVPTRYTAEDDANAESDDTPDDGGGA
ncbi:MAG: ligase-associated DNA damage response exonuclease [Planctomycetota bacterium]